MSLIGIHAVPQDFHLTDSGVTSQAVAFAIPTGVYLVGYWEIIGSANSNFAVFHTLTMNAHTCNGTIMPVAGVGYDDRPPTTLPLTAAQLADVNAAAGGSLNATVSYSGGGLPAVFDDHITDLIIWLDTIQSGSDKYGVLEPQEGDASAGRHMAGVLPD